MKRFAYLLLSTALLALALPAIAQTVTADIAITVSTDLTGNVTAGQTGQISVILFNHGPEDTLPSASPGFSVSPIRRVDQGGQAGNSPEIELSVDPSSNTVCQGGMINPGAPFPGEFVFLVSLNNPLAANGSSTCVLNYRLNFGVGYRALDFTAQSGNSQDIDPDPGNNSVHLVFGIPPQPIPVFSHQSLLALFVLVLFLAWHHLTFRPT